MQRVELNHAVDAIHCPFCGHCVLGERPGEDHPAYIGPCPHTLFVAHDEGFEFRSDIFNELAGLPDGSGDIDVPEDGVDSLTDAVELPNSVKFASYVPAPSFFGAYFGFYLG